METSTVGLTSAAQPFIAADSAVDVTLNLDMTQACEPQCGLVVSAGTAAELLTLAGRIQHGGSHKNISEPPSVDLSAAYLVLRRRPPFEQRIERT